MNRPLWAIQRNLGHLDGHSGNESICGYMSPSMRPIGHKDSGYERVEYGTPVSTMGIMISKSSMITRTTMKITVILFRSDRNFHAIFL